jgi:hypothetical protein
MNNPTHFIEVWKHSSGKLNNDNNIDTIDQLQNHLNATDAVGCKTVAIWKIKFK